MRLEVVLTETVVFSKRKKLSMNRNQNEMVFKEKLNLRTNESFFFVTKLHAAINQLPFKPS